MKTKTKKVICYVFSAAVLVVLGQNCSGVKFGGGSNQQAAQALGQPNTAGSDTVNGTSGAVNPPDVMAVPQDSTDYICVLQGNGDSTVLGLDANGDLAPQNGIPGAICMSSHACLDLVSTKFQVHGLFPGKGVCPHNGNVTTLTDAQVQAKL